MSAGFTFIGSALSADLKQYEEVLTLGGVGLLLVGSVSIARVSLSSRKTLVPEAKMSLRNLVELVAEFLVRLSDSTMGKENRKFLPFVATIFIFLFSMNMIGLVPGMVAPTHKFTVNLGLSAIVFLVYNISGIRELGLLNYLKHFWGPGILVGGFVFCVEIISHLIRPLSLSLRLFGNMTGDHLVLGVFTDLTKAIFVPVPVIFYMMGTLVCFIQAFVFTLLTMVYIRLAVAHDHSGDHSGDHGGDHGGHHGGHEEHGHAGKGHHNH